MTSPLPPKRRDSRNLADLIRQDRTRLSQLDHGLVGGRYTPARPVKPRWDDNGEDDLEDESLNFLNTDRAVAAGSGNATMLLTYTPVDGSEHVTWYPAGGGGIRLPAWAWVRTDRTVTILAFDGLSSGDVFTCEYAYLDQEPDPISPSLVGYTVPGTWNSTAKTVSYAMPTGTASGDLLVLTFRGEVAAGGGELLYDASCGDSRLKLAYHATTMNGGQAVVEAVYVGIADGSGSSVVVSVSQNPSYNGVGADVLAAWTGVNGYGVISPTETAPTTPVVNAVATVAVTWIRTTTFSVVTAAQPSGYTYVASTGSAYSSTAIGWWYDSAADSETATSPTGTFVGEGCCIIAMI